MSAQIRIANKGDASEILRIYRPIVESTSISFEIVPPSLSEIESRIETTLRQYPWLVHVQDKKVVGYVYASVFRSRHAYQWSCEVTAYVDDDYRGQGIAKKLYQTLFKILRKQGYIIAIGGITLPNAASVALHESVGFKKVAHYPALGYKMNQWHDVGFWQTELSAIPTSPKDPIAFNQIDPKNLDL